MDLTVVVGGREFLRPHPIDRETLSQLVAAIEPGAVVPAVVWTGSAEGAYFDRWLFDDPAEMEHRTSLLLDFLRESLSEGSSPWILLPFESAISATNEDPRTGRFLTAARGALAPTETLRSIRLSVSPIADATLRRLRALVGEPEALDGRNREALDVLTVHLASALDVRTDLGAQITMNYNRAVLSLAEVLVSRHTVFGARDRASRLARALDRDGLYIRPDAPTEDVLAALSPGGELYAALTRVNG